MSRLNDFLCQLLQAVEQSAAAEATPDWFDEKAGICDNWGNYTDQYNIPRHSWEDGFCGLRDKFRRDNLDHGFPFNTGLTDYVGECHDYTIWENTARLEWLQAEVTRIQHTRKSA